MAVFQPGPLGVNAVRHVEEVGKRELVHAVLHHQAHVEGTASVTLKNSSTATFSPALCRNLARMAIETALNTKNLTFALLLIPPCYKFAKNLVEHVNNSSKKVKKLSSERITTY